MNTHQTDQGSTLALSTPKTQSPNVALHTSATSVTTRKTLIPDQTPEDPNISEVLGHEVSTDLIQKNSVLRSDAVLLNERMLLW